MRKTILISFILILILLIFPASGCQTADKPLSSSEYYKGKTITLTISSDPGSLADLVSRIIANRLTIDIKGNVNVENRREAGGLEGMNYLYQAEPNGLTLGTTSAIKFITNKILGDPAATYELEQFSYILKIDSEQTFFMVSNAGSCQSINDFLNGSNLKIGAGTASGYSTLAGLTIIDLLNLDAKVITGFENNTARALATQRGEVIGYTSNLGAVKAELDTGTLRPLFVIATQRDPSRPDVPAISELVTLSEPDLALLKLWENELSAGTLLAAPPGISEDKIRYLCDLAEEWCQDDSFKQEIDRVSGHPVLIYTSGERVAESIHHMAAAFENFQSRFAEMIEKYRT